MLVTDRADLAEKARMLRGHGMSPCATGQSLPVAEDLARRVKEEDTPPVAFKPLLIQHPWCTQGYLVVWIGLLSLALPGFGQTSYGTSSCQAEAYGALFLQSSQTVQGHHVLCGHKLSSHS